MASWIVTLGYISSSLIHFALFIWVMSVLERRNASWGWRLWFLVVYAGLGILLAFTFWDGK